MNQLYSDLIRTRALLDQIEASEARQSRDRINAGLDRAEAVELRWDAERKLRSAQRLYDDATNRYEWSGMVLFGAAVLFVAALIVRVG